MGKTPASSALEKSVNNFLNDYNQKLEIALEKSKEKIETRLKEIIDDITRRYYAGYIPRIYIRQHQLYGINPPLTTIEDIGDGYHIHSDILDDEDGDYGYKTPGFDHRKFSVHVMWRTKSGYHQKTYHYNLETVDEERIYREYEEGIHHRVGRRKSPEVKKLMQMELDKFCKGEMREIIDNELKKIT